MRILVTGASGLLGLNLVLEAARAHAVTGVTHSRALQGQNFEVQQADLARKGTVERLLEQTTPDWVINCAALANLDACEAQPDLAHSMNTGLPAELAKHVARGGARLVHISTDSVFDGQKGDYREDDAPNPLGVYARTKLAGETAVLERDPSAIVARVNMIGWSLSGTRSLAEFFYYNLAAGRPVKGFTDVFFCPLLVNDLAQALLEMLEHGLSGLYHAVGSQCLSKYDFGVKLAQQFGLDSRLIAPISVAESGLAAARSPNLSLRSDKLALALGRPLPSVDSALEKLHRQRADGYPERLKSLSV
jgi:dTDP-4-dehydrorhamnose reductase